jgi:hypothetical protein
MKYQVVPTKHHVVKGVIRGADLAACSLRKGWPLSPPPKNILVSFLLPLLEIVSL